MKRMQTICRPRTNQVLAVKHIQIVVKDAFSLMPTTSESKEFLGLVFYLDLVRLVRLAATRTAANARMATAETIPDGNSGTGTCDSSK